MCVYIYPNFLMKSVFVSQMGHVDTLDHVIVQPQDHDQMWNVDNDAASTVGLSLDRNELSDWVEQITEQLIHDDVASLVSEDNFVNSMHTDFRPGKLPRTDNSDNDKDCRRVDDSDTTRELDLMTHLMESAVAISVENLGEARQMLLEISESASPHAPSCAERVVAYFAQAMTSRVVGTWLGGFGPALPAISLVNYQNTLLHNAFQAFNAVSPFVKFAHFTANQAILEAFHNQPFVHVIDLDVMQGLQWPALFHILATRAEGPPERVRLTAVGSLPEILSSTGKTLVGFAKRFGISFEFNPITRNPGENLHPSMFNLRHGETLAVHLLRHCLYDATGSDRQAINTIIGDLRPRIFTLVEQDIMSHGGSFLDRFVASLHYHSTVFVSLGAWLRTDDRNRYLVESGLLYREIRNMLAVGGPGQNGKDDQQFVNWRPELAARTAGSGLAQVAMSRSAVAQAQLILNMAPGGGGGYSLVQGEGCIRAGWKGTSLYTASAWTCMH